jgi:D-alanine-D-alanine ligase
MFTLICVVFYDNSINFKEGAWDEDTPGIDVVMALERNRKPFTGASSRCYDPKREDMKKICYYWKISTPKYFFAYNSNDLANVEKLKMKFPLFVKHYHGYNSVGLTERSKVNNMKELDEQTEIMIKTYGAALIEEFIDGREFSVLICSNPDPNATYDPITFKPVECVFEGLNYKTFEMKWKGSKNPWVVVDDKELAKRLQEISKEMFIALGLDGTLYSNFAHWHRLCEN